MWVSNRTGLTLLNHLLPLILTWACKISLQAPMYRMGLLKLTLLLAKLWCKPILTPKLQTIIILSIAKTTRLLKVHTGDREQQVQSSRTWFTFHQAPQFRWAINLSTTQVGPRKFTLMEPETHQRLERGRARRGEESGVARGNQSRKITSSKARPLITSITTKEKTQGHLVYRRRWM
jgi:hypothetical protein